MLFADGTGVLLRGIYYTENPDLYLSFYINKKTTQGNYWQNFFICLWYNLSINFYEKHTLHYCRYIDYWMVVGCICMECRWFNSHPHCISSDISFVRYYSPGLKSLLFFSYTRSILSARLQFSTVAIFCDIDSVRII